jgi:hypothetical protein
MTFAMKRWRDVDGATAVEDGGVATFGYIDSSQYTGDITYLDVPSGSQYWQVTMGGMTSQGTDIGLNGATNVAIDTGTTLIGGPESIVTSVYAAINGSRRMTGNYKNYYEYPCTSDISLTLNFGGFNINIGSGDFNLGRYGSDSAYCTGAVFVQALNGPVQWIVGATVLKNASTIFRHGSPSQVGFAALPGGSSSNSAAGASVYIPTATATIPDAGAVPVTGSVAPSATASVDPSILAQSAVVVGSATASASSASGSARSSASSGTRSAGASASDGSSSGANGSSPKGTNGVTVNEDGTTITVVETSGTVTATATSTNGASARLPALLPLLAALPLAAFF